MRGLLTESPPIPQTSAVSSCLPRDCGSWRLSRWVGVGLEGRKRGNRVDRHVGSFHNAQVSTGAHSFFVTCAKGTEGALRRELVSLRIHGPRGATGGVSFVGTFMDGMKVCLHSRVAMRVLLEVAAFPATDATHLYAGARNIDWSDFVGRGLTAVSATTQDNPRLRHSGFAALKVKDAVVDMLRDHRGFRPDVNPRNPDVSIVLHLRGKEAHRGASLPFARHSRLELSFI